MKIKKISLIVFIILMTLLTNGCVKPNEPNDPIEKEEIEFYTEEQTINLLIGETYVPKLTVKNLAVYELEYIYDESLIIIENETITALKKGSCEVEVYIKDHHEVDPVKFHVVIEQIIPEEIICETEVKIYLHGMYKLDIKMNPTNATKKIIAKSYDTNIAVCDEEGVIIGIGVGQTYILIKSAVDVNVSIRILVTVEQPPIKEIEVIDSVDLNYFDNYQLSWRVWPNGANQEVSFRSLNPEIASVNLEGLITAHRYGTTTVRVQSTSDPSKYADVLVTVSGDMTTDLIVPNKTITLQIGTTINLEYEILPSTACPEIDISVDDSNGLFIENNQITAIKVGTYKLSLQTIDSTNICQEIIINVIGEETPIFVTNDKFIEQSSLSWNEEFNPLDNIKAFDNKDGDITNQIVVNGEVDNRRYGEYMLEYIIKDSDGNQQTLVRKVSVAWDYDVMVVGHAGSYYGVPNSEEAILYAAEVLKYPAIEIDLKQTKDGIFVLSHDPKWGDAVLEQTNFNDLKDVEYTVVKTGGLVGGHLTDEERTYTAKICTFERYLEICKQYNIVAVIELKTSTGVSNWTELNAPQQSKMSQIMELIKKYDMLDRVVFLSSQEQCLNWVKTHGYSYIPCQYLTLSSCENEKTFNIVKQYNLDISFNVRDGIKISDEWLAKYRDLGCKLAVFTFEEYARYEDIQYWIDRGVDYVTTDWHELDKLNLPKSENK